MTSKEYDFQHKPVLLNECLEALNIKKNGIYVDCTVGGAGHSVPLLKQLDAKGTLICLDKDAEAIETTRRRITETLSETKVIFVQNDFSEIKEILHKLNIEQVDGILADFGVSSHQLDRNVRGFGYMQDGPLDMRMDMDTPLTARKVVNTYSTQELEKIFFGYGEERYGKRIAAKICEQRKINPIETTLELSEIIINALPPQARREKQHPAKRTFQAIRIEVNHELDSIQTLLSFVPSVLASGGRFVGISFHSLEDRLVKDAIRKFENPCTCPKSFPVCNCGKKPLGKNMTRKPITAGEAEIENNPRARSAKLRVFEKY